MKSEFLENKVKIIFIGCKTFLYYYLSDNIFIYFEEENDELEENGANLSNMDKAIINSSDNVSNMNNNRNLNTEINREIQNSNSLSEYEKTEFNETANLLDNVKDESYKNNEKLKQVFNISNNVFTYDDAKAVCKHNADLTAIKVLESYKKEVVV